MNGSNYTKLEEKQAKQDINNPLKTTSFLDISEQIFTPSGPIYLKANVEMHNNKALTHNKVLTHTF